MLVPYIKSRGTRGTKMSANADLITVETYVHCTTRGNNLKTSFSFMGQNGGGGSSMIRLDLSCFPAILSPIYMCTYEIGKQSDKTFLSLTPKYLGGPGGGLTSNPGERKFQGSKTS